MATVRSTSKGQITRPKKIRDLLNTAVVPFSMQDGNGFVRDAARALQRYAGNNKSAADFKKLKDKAWEAAARNKKCKPS
jgi:bifunctional DNA-binding transcriptional regulator/antitoxin component of YhaV-PrlF toxin-antitoxin module